MLNKTNSSFPALRNATLAAAFFGLAACESVALVEPGPFQVGKDFQFQVGQSWAAFPKNTRTRLQTLTIDGQALNSLVVGASIEDGKPLLYSTDREKIIPLFRSDMSQSELVEFVADTFSYVGSKDVVMSGLRPEPFGTLDGIAFDMAFSTSSGLNMSGIGKAVVEDGKLHLILYTAPSEHYFGLHKAEVENIMASVILL